MSTVITATFLLLHFNASHIIVVAVSVMMGIPTSGITVTSYQFLAEVSYPVSEIQCITIMNMFNKILSFGFVKLTSKLTTNTPDHIKYMNGFILWIFMPLIGLIPAFLVEEDLRRLNLKEVKASKYVEEEALLSKTVIERNEFYKNNNVIANKEVLGLFFELDEPKHKSERTTYRSERMTNDDDEIRFNRRRSAESVTSGRPSKQMNRLLSLKE